MKFKIFLIIFVFAFSSASANEKLNKVLQELQQIKKDLKTLEKAVYSQSFKGKKDKQSSGSLEGALTRQLVKITELEEQMQKLTASHEEVMFSFEQLNERSNKTQRDNELRLSDLESGDVKKIAKRIDLGDSRRRRPTASPRRCFDRPPAGIRLVGCRGICLRASRRRPFRRGWPSRHRRCRLDRRPRTDGHPRSRQGHDQVRWRVDLEPRPRTSDRRLPRSRDLRRRRSSGRAMG